MRILHVAHHLGSGVETAIADYVAVAPQHEHHLFFSPDPSCEIERGAGFATETRADSSLRGYAAHLRRTVATLAPDVVHAHSSVAGGVCRVVLSRRRTTLVYTPHCFAFERRDVSRPARSAFWLAERVLASRTSVIAACSPHEQTLAARLPVRVEYVPNVAHVAHVAHVATGPRPGPTPAASGRLRVVTSGRVAPQKDPALLADVARRVGPNVDVEWIGGGDAALVDVLRSTGVNVTGWVSREQAVERLASADVYVHTARWESAPMSVLEAAALGVPVLARDTPALRALGCEPLWRTPDELRGLLGSPSALERARSSGAALTARHTTGAQADALERVYAGARSRMPTGAAHPDRVTDRAWRGVGRAG